MMNFERKKWEEKHDCEKVEEICDKRLDCYPRMEFCCRPKIDCVDVAVKTFTLLREQCNPCKPTEVVICYQVTNQGAGIATNVVLKSFICPEPKKICVKAHDHNARFTYKNGIFTYCIDKIKPCECVEIEVAIIECKNCECRFEDKIDKYEIATFVEPKEQDLNVCNNVDFTTAQGRQQRRNDFCCW